MLDGGSNGTLLEQSNSIALCNYDDGVTTLALSFLLVHAQEEMLCTALNPPALEAWLGICRDGVPDSEEQLVDLQMLMTTKDDRIDDLEAYLANILQEGISNHAVLRDLHNAITAKDATIAELQAYIDSELSTESQDQTPAAKSGKADSAVADDDSDSAQAEDLSYGQTTLKISQLKAQIHRLESRLDSSSSESSSEEEVQAEEDVQKSWWSAKADSLTAEVVRLQTEAAEAEERHAVSLQVSLAVGLSQ